MAVKPIRSRVYRRWIWIDTWQTCRFESYRPYGLRFSRDFLSFGRPIIIYTIWIFFFLEKIIKFCFISSYRWEWHTLPDCPCSRVTLSLSLFLRINCLQWPCIHMILLRKINKPVRQLHFIPFGAFLYCQVLKCNTYT